MSWYKLALFGAVSIGLIRLSNRVVRRIEPKIVVRFYERPYGVLQCNQSTGLLSRA